MAAILLYLMVPVGIVIAVIYSDQFLIKNTTPKIGAGTYVGDDLLIGRDTLSAEASRRDRI